MFENLKPMDFKVDRSLIIRQSKQFFDHKKGIPEWLKNSNDSYIRFENQGTDCSKLPIILYFTNNSLFCLDFGGADGEYIQKRGFNYGDPGSANCNQKFKNVEGGHGNGGKYYAISQFEKTYLQMYFKGKYSEFIITKDNDYPVEINKVMSPEDAFNKINLNLKSNEFSKIVNSLDYDIFEELYSGKHGFFCWKGINPEDKSKFDRYSFDKLINSIVSNKQSKNTIKNRQVIVIHGNKFFNKLELPSIVEDPDKGPWKFKLPDNFQNKKFNKKGDSYLIVKFSYDKLTGDFADLNCLDIYSNNKSIGYYNLPIFLGNKGTAKNLFAEIDCPELEEYGCVDNDRTNLIDNELSGEFLNFCRNSIFKVISEVDESERKETDIKKFKDVSQLLNKIMDKLSDILEEPDLMNYVENKEGHILKNIDVASNNLDGFGSSENKIIEKGGGKRKGGLEKKEVNTNPKKSKNKSKILLSNFDPDPFNSDVTYDLTERDHLLSQRPEDVDYGYWWLNTQKKYMSYFKEKNQKTTSFYLFIVKEVVFCQKSRKEFKTDIYNPDSVEALNFDLIDTIFSRVVDDLNLDFSDNKSKEILEYILEQDSFYINDIANNLNCDEGYVNIVISNNKDTIKSYFKKIKENNKNKYIKKNIN